MHSGTQKQESKSLQIQETKKGLKPTIKMGTKLRNLMEELDPDVMRVGLNELEISQACAWGTWVPCL